MFVDDPTDANSTNEILLFVMEVGRKSYVIVRY